MRVVQALFNEVGLVKSMSHQRSVTCECAYFCEHADCVAGKRYIRATSSCLHCTIIYIWCPKVRCLLQRSRGEGFVFSFSLFYQVTADAFQVSEIEKEYSCRRKPGSDKCLLCSFVDGCILSGSTHSHPEIQRQTGSSEPPSLQAVQLGRGEHFAGRSVRTALRTLADKMHCNHCSRDAKFIFNTRDFCTFCDQNSQLRIILGESFCVALVACLTPFSSCAISSPHSFLHTESWNEAHCSGGANKLRVLWIARHPTLTSKLLLQLCTFVASLCIPVFSEAWQKQNRFYHLLAAGTLNLLVCMPFYCRHAVRFHCRLHFM